MPPVMSDIEFTLRAARVLMPVNPLTATELINHVAATTFDPKLHTRVNMVLAALARPDQKSAMRWLDRSIEYLVNRLNERRDG